MTLKTKKRYDVRRGRPARASYADSTEERASVLAKMSKEKGAAYLECQAAVIRLISKKPKRRAPGAPVTKSISWHFMPRRLPPGWRTSYLEVIGLTGKNHRNELLYTCECKLCGTWIDRSGADLRQAARRGHTTSCYQCYREICRQRAYRFPAVRQSRQKRGLIDIKPVDRLTAPLYIGSF